MEARDPPKSGLVRGPRQKRHNMRSVHYLLCFHHVGTSRNTSFLIPFCYPKVVKNRVLHRGRQKGFKSEVPVGTITRHGVHMGPPRVPRETQGSPKTTQNSSKIEVLCAGWPPGSAKAPPGSKKSPELKENRCKTPARPCVKNRGSDAHQKAFSEALPQNPAEKICCGCCDTSFLYTSLVRGGLSKAQADKQPNTTTKNIIGRWRKYAHTLLTPISIQWIIHRGFCLSSRCQMANKHVPTTPICGAAGEMEMKQFRWWSHAKHYQGCFQSGVRRDTDRTEYDSEPTESTATQQKYIKYI